MSATPIVAPLAHAAPSAGTTRRANAPPADGLASTASQLGAPPTRSTESIVVPPT